MQFARCVVQDPFCPQPDDYEDEEDDEDADGDAADDDSDDDEEEPSWVKQAIDTKDPDNLLVLVKNVDAQWTSSPPAANL